MESLNLLKDINLKRHLIGNDLQMEKEILAKAKVIAGRKADDEVLTNLIIVLGELLQKGSSQLIQPASDLISEVCIKNAPDKTQLSEMPKEEPQIHLKKSVQEYIKAIMVRDPHPLFSELFKRKVVELIRYFEWREPLDEVFNFLNRALIEMEDRSKGVKTEGIGQLLQIKSAIKARSRELSLREAKID